MTQQKVALSLFWRTFFLLLLLLAATVAAWAYTWRMANPAAWLGPRHVPHLTSVVRLLSLIPILRFRPIEEVCYRGAPYP